MLLSFKHSVHIKLQLENGSYEQSRLLMVHGLQSSQMLLHSIMHAVAAIPFPCPLSARELQVSFVHEFDVSVRGDQTEIRQPQRSIPQNGTDPQWCA